jgi:hypothetical protein
MKNIQQRLSAFKINIAVKGIHEFDDAISQSAEGILQEEATPCTGC